jgi:regulator of nucleoside diphosphate kinase
MSLTVHAPIITDLDAARIRELGGRLPGGGRHLAELGDLIDLVAEHAEIVPRASIGADVVTVNSTVSFRDQVTGSVHTVTVVYPSDFSISERRISVLSPAGRALLGRKVGQRVEIVMPNGATREVHILALHYQPEAAGDAHL